MDGSRQGNSRTPERVHGLDPRHAQRSGLCTYKPTLISQLEELGLPGVLASRSAACKEAGGFFRLEPWQGWKCSFLTIRLLSSLPQFWLNVTEHPLSMALGSPRRQREEQMQRAVV